MSTILKGVSCSVSEENQGKLIDLLKHFPKVFNTWLFFLKITNPNRFLTTIDSLGRCEDVFHMLIVNAYKETDLPKRKEALKKVVSVVNAVVNAGRKEMNYYTHVLFCVFWLVDYPKRDQIDRL